ncbi:MAG: Na/Pi symporter [Candidatus Absconditabacteria bacterium]|nr:Na/Pi symporter [Candidatus Absconditabacteria bacterium]
MTREQIGLLVGGLGMFLFGTMAFEEAIGFLVTKNFRNLLKTATRNLISSISTGFFATSILQSSAVVSLIAVSFVGAGIIGLENAIGIILGTNIGAPLMDIVLGNLGLKFSLSSIALPMIGIAGFAFLIFARYGKIKNISRAIVGLGLIFLGLGFMKDSMMVLSASVDFSQYVSLSSIAYFGIGFLVTVLMQSSSATNILVLTAASSGIVDYRMGIPMIMGAFLGTTLTVVLGSFGPNVLKKQVAFSHVFFNLFSVILGLVFLHLIVMLFENSFVDVVLGLSVFAIGFKIVGVVLISPFIGYFARFLQKLFPVKETKIGLSLEQVDPKISDAALVAMKNDTVLLLKKTFAYILHVWSVDEKILLRNRLTLDKVLSVQKNVDENFLQQEYSLIKMMEESLVAFGAQIKRHSMKVEEVNVVDELYSVITSSALAAKYMKDISHNVLVFEEQSTGWLAKQYDIFRSMLVNLYIIISEVIDGKESDEMLSKMLSLVQDIKTVDQEFMISLTKEFSKDKVRKFDLSDILHVNRYVYSSSLSFVDAIKHLYLQSVEKKVFDELK